MASQLELLHIIFHFHKDILYSSLLCASFPLAGLSQLLSLYLLNQLFIPSPKGLSLIISRLNFISGNWIHSWSRNIVHWRYYNTLIITWVDGKFEGDRFPVPRNQNAIHVVVNRVWIASPWGRQYLYFYTLGL